MALCLAELLSNLGCGALASHPAGADGHSTPNAALREPYAHAVVDANMARLVDLVLSRTPI